MGAHRRRGRSAGLNGADDQVRRAVPQIGPAQTTRFLPPFLAA